jgi:hypothetical protein
VAQARAPRQLALEALGLGPGGQPEVEARAHELDDLLGPEDLAGDRHRRGGRVEGGALVVLGGVFGDELEDLRGGGSHTTRVDPVHL